MSEKVPDVDGTPIDQIIKRADGIDNPSWGGCYMRFEAVSEREYRSRRRFTAFVQYHADTSYASVEEIDVIATDNTDAQIITELALLWHYEPGGKIILVSEVPESTFHHFY
jgi:hypothetical protein